MARKIVARVIVAILLGLVIGYAAGVSVHDDVATGRALTLKEYIADFEHHKQELIDSGTSMAAMLLGGVIFLIALLGVYELLALGVEKALAVVDRRHAVGGPPPGPPPSW